VGIFALPILPSLLSFQDTIDPDNITDSYDPSANLAIFNNQSVYVPKSSSVLGDSITLPNSSHKQIFVDLNTQKLTAMEDGQKKFEYTISSGTWNRTPNGTFTIWTKVRSQKMSGGSKELGTYYYLPNVPHVLFFYNDKTPKKVGYSIHGAYWHNNFGVPMSHGCINMRTTEVGFIYDWAEVGTTITITGKYKSSLAVK
jgi:lipoprotein-anchoring transpeptidase ErfK/SrfK